MKSSSANRLQAPPEFPRSGQLVTSHRRSARLREEVARPLAIDLIEKRLGRDLPPTDRQLAGPGRSRHDKLRRAARNTTAVALGVVAFGAVGDLVGTAIGNESNSNAALTRADHRAAVRYGELMNKDHLTLDGQPDPLPAQPSPSDTPPSGAPSQ